MQGKVFSPNKTLNIRGKLMDFNVPKVMGILNVTPDSFYDGGKSFNGSAAEVQAARMLHEGADILDIGGYSTRPGAAEISEEEELARVIPVILQIIESFPQAILSIDTFRAEVARKSIEAGASIINDISGGNDPKMFETVASLRVPYVLMHMRGNPKTMNQLTEYHLLLKEVVEYLQVRIRQLHELGISDIIVDPGFGFAKNVKQNFELLKNLDYLQILGKPVLAGLSRKSMIWRTLETDPEGSLNGTTSLNTIALMKGADMLRVHDVKEAIESIRLVGKMPPASQTLPG